MLNNEMEQEEIGVIKTVSPVFTTGLYCVPTSDKIKVEIFANFFHKTKNGKFEYRTHPEVLIERNYVEVPKGTFNMAIIVSDFDSQSDIFPN